MVLDVHLICHIYRIIYDRGGLTDIIFVICSDTIFVIFYFTMDKIIKIDNIKSGYAS